MITKDELIAKINAVTPLIITALGLVNGVLQLKGLPCIEIGGELITSVVNGLATVIGTIWGWWRNNNWTAQAQTVQPVLNGLKDGTITTQEVDSLVNSSGSSKDQD